MAGKLPSHLELALNIVILILVLLWLYSFMKTLRFFICFIFLFIVFPASAFAHLPGQPPYVLINGEYAGLYHVLSTSLPDFALPQDDAPATYLSHTAISFKIDTQRLIAPPVSIPANIVNESAFIWNFGDGQADGGLIVRHVYTHPGSYFLNLTVRDQSMPAPQLLDIALLQILPDRRYVLPKAVIVMDGVESNTASHAHVLSFDTPHLFDAGHSSLGSKKVVSYFWDFGDGTFSTLQRVSHTYSPTIREAFPLLRIKDVDGFISDTYITIVNQAFDTQSGLTNSVTNSPPQKHLPSFLQLPWVLLFIISFCILFFVSRWVFQFIHNTWVS